MEDTNTTENTAGPDVRQVMRGVIEEFLRAQQVQNEPAHKAELEEERRRREQLERRVNELVEENRKSREAAEEAERTATIRAELQKLGVTKVDLAFRAVKEDIFRGEGGRLAARTDAGEVPMQQFLTQFIQENPELLPGRIRGGSGANAAAPVSNSTQAPVEIDSIRPGMNPEDLDRVRKEIARVARQTIRGM